MVEDVVHRHVFAHGDFDPASRSVDDVKNGGHADRHTFLHHRHVALAASGCERGVFGDEAAQLLVRVDGAVAHGQRAAGLVIDLREHEQVPEDHCHGSVALDDVRPDDAVAYSGELGVDGLGVRTCSTDGR